MPSHYKPIQQQKKKDENPHLTGRRRRTEDARDGVIENHNPATKKLKET